LPHQPENNHSLCFFLLLTIFIFLSSCGQDRRPSVLDIMQQWSAIEQNLFTGGGQGSIPHSMQGDTPPILEQVDTFLDSIQAFHQSEMYRIYHLIAPASEINTQFLSDSISLEDISLENITGMVQNFRNSVIAGDKEKAAVLSAQINGALVQWLTLDEKVARYYDAAYIRLILTFVFVIALTSTAVFIISKALARSLDREAENTAFTQAILLAKEEEGERISRELHDTIAQDLRYLSLGMDKISRTRDDSEREKLCLQTSEAQSALIRRIRDICNALVPPDFRLQGLCDALRRLCHDFGKRTGINCHAEITEDINPNSLNPEKQLQIFRIIQEALTNIEKHAGAGEAIVTMCTENGKGLYIGISDDGKGFDPPDEKTPYSNLTTLGIRGMRKRAALLDGNLEINSIPGEGTLVRLELPHING